MLEKPRKNNYLLWSSVDELLRTCMQCMQYALSQRSSTGFSAILLALRIRCVYLIFNVLELSTLFLCTSKYWSSVCPHAISPHNDCSGYIDDDDDPLFFSLRLLTRPTNITFSHYLQQISSPSSRIHKISVSYVFHGKRYSIYETLVFLALVVVIIIRTYIVCNVVVIVATAAVYYCCCGEPTQYICDYQLVHISFILVTRSLFCCLTPKTLIKFQNSQTVHGMVEKCSNGNYVLYMSTGNFHNFRTKHFEHVRWWLSVLEWANEVWGVAVVFKTLIFHNRSIPWVDA